MTDTYANWSQLQAANTLGIDYRLPIRKNNSTVLNMAIHGGAIEPGSSEVASEVAAANYQNYYSLEGIKASGNSDLHITSTNYDEPHALSMVAKSTYCFSFHGMTGTVGVASTFVGGLDTVTRDAVIAALTRAGFTASTGSSELNGDDPNNITNKTTRNAGVQIEISNQQRQNFFPSGDLSRANRETGIRTDEFYRYVRAIASIAGPVEPRLQQTSNYKLNEPVPTDQMNDFETWLNANWTKLGNINKFAPWHEVANSLPTAGNYQPGDRVINLADNSSYVCLVNDLHWGIFWRPVFAPISPWRKLTNNALSDTLNWTVEDASQPVEYAIDNTGWIHWRGIVKWIGAGGILKSVDQTPFYPMPDGIQPRENMTFMLGHETLTVTAGGTPATEWEGVKISIPHTLANDNMWRITALAGNGAGSVTKVHFNGQMNWPIGSGVF